MYAALAHVMCDETTSNLTAYAELDARTLDVVTGRFCGESWTT